MTNKKIAEQILKYDAIVTDPILKHRSIVDGFSVTENLHALEYESFKSYFRSNYFHLVFVESGELTVSINLVDYHLVKNDFVISVPFDIKKTIKIDDCVLSVLIFTSDFLENTELLKNSTEVLAYFTSQYSPLWTLNKADAVLLKKLIKDMAARQDTLTTHPFGRELLYLSFSTFLYEVSALGAKYAQLIKKNISRKENLVINFTVLVTTHFKKEKSLQFYASELNITAKYLTETVKEITTKTAGEIIESFVMQEAKMLLNNPELSIAEIADELNFSDQSFFGKFFKRCAGMSPKNYRSLYQ